MTTAIMIYLAVCVLGTALAIPLCMAAKRGDALRGPVVAREEMARAAVPTTAAPDALAGVQA